MKHLPEPHIERTLPLLPVMLIAQCVVLLVIGSIGRCLGVW